MEELRETMRKWVTGVSIVTVFSEGVIHGSTVGSLVSVSIDPPRIAITLANNTRTHRMLQESGNLGVTLLASNQQSLAEKFSGKSEHGDDDRFNGVNIQYLPQNIPVIEGGLAHLTCKVVHQFPMENSTLFVCEVLQASVEREQTALVYANRKYQELELI